MILIRQPAIAINDRDDSAFAHMWRDYWVESRRDHPESRTFTRERIIADVKNLARSAPGGRVLDMVICCHGHPAHLCLGPEGFHLPHVDLFREWRGLVERIYIRACNLAEIRTGPLSAYPGPNRIIRACSTCAAHDGNGDLFCKRMARAIDCTIVASTEWQFTQRGLSDLPFGRLDNYEGLVMWYGPQGQVLRNSNHFRSHSGFYHSNDE